ncbi:MAG TPA: hypothetical protein VN416_04855 [Desulfomonilia bacterium]|jgi:hypothetical protein|nr:hypothetical protein [Desulfomonilia bacterium]
MHQWRMVMTAYIALVVILAVLLGHFGDPARCLSGALENTAPGGGGACPWQLKIVTVPQLEAPDQSPGGTSHSEGLALLCHYDRERFQVIMPDE